jgi:hypothetical protein
MRSGVRREQLVPYIPGNAIQGYCVHCKGDTQQTVLEVDGLQVRTVRCEKCKSEGMFRSPRARTKARLREVAASRKTRAEKAPARKPRRKKEDPGQVFRSLVGNQSPSSAKAYSARDSLAVGQLVTHPSFGLGVVTTLTEEQKATVLFEDGPRVLICNRA